MLLEWVGDGNGYCGDGVGMATNTAGTIGDLVNCSSSTLCPDKKWTPK